MEAIKTFLQENREMEAIENIKTRRSIRVYENKAVSIELINKAIEAAQMAPSWKNSQTVNYVVIANKEKKEELLELLPSFNAKTVSTAASVVIMTTNKYRCGYERDGSYTTKKGDRWEMFDAGLAAEALCLSLWDGGIGSCIMGIYDEDGISSFIDLPENQYVTAVVALGYPAEAPGAPKRKSLEDKVRYYL